MEYAGNAWIGFPMESRAGANLQATSFFYIICIMRNMTRMARFLSAKLRKDWGNLLDLAAKILMQMCDQLLPTIGETTHGKTVHTCIAGCRSFLGTVGRQSDGFHARHGRTPEPSHTSLNGSIYALTVLALETRRKIETR